MFFEKNAFKNFVKFTGKQMGQGLFFNKVAGLQHAVSFKKSLQYRCFLQILRNFIYTSFTKHLQATASILPVMWFECNSKINIWKTQSFSTLATPSRFKISLITLLIYTWVKVFLDRVFDGNFLVSYFVMLQILEFKPENIQINI